MEPLLDGLGRRVRALRGRRGLTLQQLAGLCGLSQRFLVQVEKGHGNISVRKLDGLAQALGTTAAFLLTAGDDASPPRPSIALLGLRGAGKTTIGRRVARRLGVPFVELDRKVEQAAGLALGEVFALHGEEYYRRLEREALTSLLETRQSMVLASGGGLVAAPETFALLARRSTTVWLRATADDCWERVIRQGDRRPMNQHPEARKALADLVARRNPLYAQAALTIDTSGRSIAEAVDSVVAAAGLR